MSIDESFHFDKSGEVVRHPALRRYFLTLLIILVAGLAFGIGRLTGQGTRAGVTINTGTEAQAGKAPVGPNTASAAVVSLTVTDASIDAPATGAQVYASSQGKRYYYMSCKSTVSAANRITFASPAMAEAAGYTLASNCPKP